MNRNEILKVAGEFYKPETITEREVAFARHMMNYEREMCALICEKMRDALGNRPHPSHNYAAQHDFAAKEIRARGEA